MSVEEFHYSHGEFEIVEEIHRGKENRHGLMAEAEFTATEGTIRDWL